jgi:hypothetical protein
MAKRGIDPLSIGYWLFAVTKPPAYLSFSDGAAGMAQFGQNFSKNVEKLIKGTS